MSPSAGGGGGTGSRTPQEARGKVVWSATMSLDGFVAGLGDRRRSAAFVAAALRGAL